MRRLIRFLKEDNQVTVFLPINGKLRTPLRFARRIFNWSPKRLSQINALCCVWIKLRILFLMYGSVRVSNLKHFNLAQVRNLFRYQDVIILPTKTKSVKTWIIPIVWAAESIIEPARPYWEELLDIMAKKYLEVDDSYNSPRENPNCGELLKLVS